MPNTFILEDLDPERPALQFGEDRYLAALPDDFGLDTEATLLSLRKKLGEIDKEQEKNRNSIPSPKLLRNVEHILGEIIQIYFPDMPASLIKKIPTAKKVELMGWWGDNCYPQSQSRLISSKRGWAA